MPQVINTNVISMQARRSLDHNQGKLNVSLERLSSGLRINSAKDDAAGLAISERMVTQVRGLNQARRNINDAVSLVQTSEGALSEMTNLFQRGRELAVQAANATLSSADRVALQQELTQLVSEVDRISSTQDFNGVKLFDGGSRNISFADDAVASTQTAKQKQIVEQLQKSWLEQGEAMITQYYGIQGDGAGLNIQFVEGQDYLAAVSFSGFDSDGKGVNLSLNIDLSDFQPSNGVNGGPSFVSNDRILMHELTHAVMGRTMNIRDMPLWFVEGTAEFIHGADARLNADLSQVAGASNAAKVANLMSTYLDADGTAQLYSAGYAAVGYLHQAVIAAGGTGIKEVFNYLQSNAGSTLDDALAAMKTAHSSLAFGNVAQLKGMFAIGQAGNTYLVNRITSGSLTNSDTGAVGGADADGGSRDTTANGVVPDTFHQTTNPLAGFTETFPTGTPDKIKLEKTGVFAFQVGANVGETINVDRVAINAGSLGIDKADLTVDPELAIIQFDRALSVINTERARLGALSNRFESANNAMDISIENVSSSRSRIVDADFAQETAALVKQQILQQAGMSIMLQANSNPQMVLSLLR